MDWKLLIAELQQRNWTQAQIAAHCECTQSTVSDIATGETKNPSFKTGQALIALHKSRRKPRALELKAA